MQRKDTSRVTVQRRGRKEATLQESRSGKRWERKDARCAAAPKKLSSKPWGSIIASERLCRCTTSLPGRPKGVTVHMKVRDRTSWVPLDTGARSIWVDRDWFRSVGETWNADEYSARAADGHEMVVCGSRVLRFSFWGAEFCETAHVAANLPSTVLMGSHFWRKHSLELNLATDQANIWVNGRRIRRSYAGRMVMPHSWKLRLLFSMQKLMRQSPTWTYRIFILRGG